MTKKIKILAIVSANTVFAGALCKACRLPLANILLLLGILICVGLFIPAVNSYTFKKQKSLFPLVLIGSIAIAISLVSATFALNRWPFRDIAVLVGVFVPLILFLPTAIYYYSKTGLINLKQFVALIGAALFLSLLDAGLAMNYSREYIAGTVQINSQLEKLNATYLAANESSISKTSAELRGLIDEARDKIGDKRLDHNYPAFKVMWYDYYGYKIQVLLKEYNAELAAKGIVIPQEFDGEWRYIGKQKEPWRGEYFDDYPSFEILNRLNRLQLYMNQSEFEMRNSM